MGGTLSASFAHGCISIGQDRWVLCPQAVVNVTFSVLGDDIFGRDLKLLKYVGIMPSEHKMHHDCQNTAVR